MIDGEFFGHMKSGELIMNSHVYVTYHIGASTNQAQKAVADEVILIVKEFIANTTVRNGVNL